MHTHPITLPMVPVIVCGMVSYYKNSIDSQRLSSSESSLWWLPSTDRRRWKSNRFPWRCTLAEGGYTIQNHGLLRKGDNSGRGLGSQSPEALRLISSTAPIHHRLIHKESAVEQLLITAELGHKWPPGPQFGHPRPTHLRPLPDHTSNPVALVKKRVVSGGEARVFKQEATLQALPLQGGVLLPLKGLHRGKHPSALRGITQVTRSDRFLYTVRIGQGGRKGWVRHTIPDPNQRSHCLRHHQPTPTPPPLPFCIREEGYPSFPSSQHRDLPSAVSPHISYQGLALARSTLPSGKHLAVREKQHEPHALNGYLNRGLSRGNVDLSRDLLRGQGEGVQPVRLALSGGAAGIPHHALPGPLTELHSSDKQLRRNRKTDEASMWMYGLDIGSGVLRIVHHEAVSDPTVHSECDASLSSKDVVCDGDLHVVCPVIRQSEVVEKQGPVLKHQNPVLILRPQSPNDVSSDGLDHGDRLLPLELPLDNRQVKAEAAVADRQEGLPPDRSSDQSVWDDSRLTGKGEEEEGRHAASVVGSGNRTRDDRVEDSGPPSMGRAVPYATAARTNIVILRQFSKSSQTEKSSPASSFADVVVSLDYHHILLLFVLIGSWSVFPSMAVLTLCEPVELYNLLNQTRVVPRLAEMNYLCLIEFEEFWVEYTCRQRRSLTEHLAQRAMRPDTDLEPLLMRMLSRMVLPLFFYEPGAASLQLGVFFQFLFIETIVIL
ncbi:hypothetical protein CCH79_00011911 [Gambusia affinis]|uniref:Uncharacterized protein n=1 Tax=Gambusia affinis TaxID=33528 RepID=A0A315VLM0_GAMAF|nr:hypothetical protein CCH79_00011911 [Gambusia affinis]